MAQLAYAKDFGFVESEKVLLGSRQANISKASFKKMVDEKQVLLNNLSVKYRLNEITNNEGYLEHRKEYDDYHKSLEKEMKDTEKALTNRLYDAFTSAIKEFKVTSGYLYILYRDLDGDLISYPDDPNLDFQSVKNENTDDVTKMFLEFFNKKAD
jgi:Skp family chaperone for outer membrane proteins